MSSCKPYGDPAKAEILVIGHDPRLQRSKTEAQYVFFMDYLERPRPSGIAEKTKYDFADSVYSYIKDLTGNKPPLSLKNIYFTNLCNTFLDRPNNKGVILIPNDLADEGIREIEHTLDDGHFKVIVPMALQVFYHLVRTEFAKNGLVNNLGAFLAQSHPLYDEAKRGLYKAAVDRSFLLVCGLTYYHKKTPVVPILFVNQGRMIKKDSSFYPLMQNAVVNIQKALRSR